MGDSYHYPQNMGRRLTLWRCEFRLDAYKDQFGIAHEGYVVLEEVAVTIVEIKDVPGMWRQEDRHDGWRAKAEDGREFFNNWTYFADDSMSPRYYWHDKGESAEWVDATSAASRFPHIRDGERAIPLNGGVCNRHQYPVFFHNDDGCWKCTHGVK